MSADSTVFALSTKAYEVLLCVSLTVNFCTLWSILIPAFCQVMDGRQSKGQPLSPALRSLDKPQPCRRFSTNLLFHLAMPICGIVVLFKTDLLKNPFLAFDNTLRVVLSVSLGHYAFKTAEVLIFRREVVHYKPLCVHHLVAIMTLATILYFEQNTVLGVVGLFLEGYLVFAELGNGDVTTVFSHMLSSRLLKFAVVIGFAQSLVFKALLPISLLASAFSNSSDELLKMDYVPLAFFFLGLVFFTAVNIWFFKDTVSEILYHWRSPPPYAITQTTIPLTSVINHEGLNRICKDHVVRIHCNNLWELPDPEKDKLNVEAVTVNEYSPAVIRTTSIVE